MSEHDIWTLRHDGYSPEDIVKNGDLFLLGNGYMGYRGTMDEWGKKEFAAVTLSGVYDKYADKWREPVNAPNALFAKLYVNGEAIALGEAEPLLHTQTLDYRHGIFTRDTRFSAARLSSERFVSMAEPHLCASRLTLEFNKDAEAELVCGVVTELWDINGPHLFNFSYNTGDILSASARTGELNIEVAAAQSVSCDFACVKTCAVEPGGVYRRIRFAAKAGQTYIVALLAAVYTSLDAPSPRACAERLCQSSLKKGYESCIAAHKNAWECIWKRSAVELTGNEQAARAMNASMYHLNSIAPRHADALSIPARGLSGQTYKGAVFWDSEIFLFPVFVHTEPELARSLLRYRVKTLPGALEKAAQYGLRGAFYPWESQERGQEGCTDYNVTDVFTHRPVRTYFRDKQIHISGDIAYALWRYYEITGDTSLLRDGGAEVILQCARFYLSWAVCHVDSERVELTDVIGPDEYHERVNNNAFTNQMASHCLDCALALEKAFEYMPSLIKKLDYAADMELIRAIAPRLRPEFKPGEVIEQFDGYFKLEDCSLDAVRGRVLDPREYWGTNHGVAAQTQIIKQADVVALMALFPKLFSEETVEKNWLYYEPRTEHGSSLSSCMYALTACRIGRLDLAWEHFMKTASIDLLGEGKQWAGEIYIGGTHPAANGGAWMIAVLGFAGLSVTNGRLTLNPRLPKELTSLRFCVTLNGKRYVVTVTHESWEARPEE